MVSKPESNTIPQSVFRSDFIGETEVQCTICNQQGPSTLGCSYARMQTLVRSEGCLFAQFASFLAYHGKLSYFHDPSI